MRPRGLGWHVVRAEQNGPRACQGTGGPKYKPPVSDINAPDLYIPLMAFFTYCLLCCIADITSSPSRFKPEVCAHSGCASSAGPQLTVPVFFRAQRLGRFVWWGITSWASEVLLLWVGLKSAASSQAPVQVPLLDLLAYAGYTFVAVSAECALGLFSRRGYYALLLWGGLCTAVFMVKTMKRIVYAEARQYGGDPSRRNYLLLALALLQVPFAWWLGHLPVHAAAPVRAT